MGSFVPSAMAPRLLKRAHIESGIEALGKQDERLARFVSGQETRLEVFPSPPQKSAFSALARSICSQQLSTKAAATIYTRLQKAVPAENDDDTCVCPHAVSTATEEELRRVGLSQSKVRSIKDLSSRFIAGTLSDEKLAAVEDLAELEALLLDVKGIGPWTAQMFAIFFLRLPDIAVTGDLGVRKGCAKIYGLSSLPTPKVMETIVESWWPHRTLGACLSWKAADLGNPRP